MYNLFDLLITARKDFSVRFCKGEIPPCFEVMITEKEYLLDDDICDVPIQTYYHFDIQGYPIIPGEKLDES